MEEVSISASAGNKYERPVAVTRRHNSLNSLKLNGSLYAEGDSTTDVSLLSSQSLSTSRLSTTVKRRFTVSEGTVNSSIRNSTSSENSLPSLFAPAPVTKLQRFDTEFASKIFKLEERQQQLLQDNFCESRFYEDLQTVTATCGKMCSDRLCSGTKKVHFHQVIIREYPVIIGDNPSVNGGIPLTIDWKFISEIPVDFESYEETREREGGRRTMEKMVLTPFHREIILKRLGFSKTDRNKAAKEATIIRNRRRASNSAEMMNSQKKQEAMETALRILKNALSLGRIKRAEKEYLRKYVPSLHKMKRTK
jgi:hypothetical protein